MKKVTHMLDLRKVIHDQNPELLKKLEGYKLNFLEWLLKMDDLNAIYMKNQDYKGVEFAQKVLDDFGVKVETRGLENIDRSQRYIFASNHPSAGIDGMAFIVAMEEVTDNFKVIVKDVLGIIKNLDPVFAYVNTYRNQKADYITKLDELYKSKAQVCILPSGACSRKIDGKIRDLDWKGHFVKKAVAYERDVIPVHISGKNPEYFYLASKFRNMIGMKYNAEELLLARALLAQKPETLTVTFGKPISYKTFDRSKSFNKWAQYVKEKVYESVEN
jgi:putative hemolysin